MACSALRRWRSPPRWLPLRVSERGMGIMVRSPDAFSTCARLVRTTGSGLPERPERTVARKLFAGGSAVIYIHNGRRKLRKRLFLGGEAGGEDWEVGWAPSTGISRERRGSRSAGIIHVKFDRARGRFPAHHFFPLELDVTVDLVVAEDIAASEEGAVVAERHQGFAQRAAHGR